MPVSRDRRPEESGKRLSSFERSKRDQKKAVAENANRKKVMAGESKKKAPSSTAKGLRSAIDKILGTRSSKGILRTEIGLKKAGVE